MKIDKKKLAIQILAFIGLLLSVKLACIYYVANYEKYALSSFCSINDFIDCDGAARSTVSQFWGIPLAYWGIFFYLTVLFMTVVDYFKKFKLLKFLEVFKNPVSYIGMLGTIAFICSMTLAGLSIFKIHKLCILCFITYFIDLLITLVACSGMFKEIVAAFKTTFVDFIAGAKQYTKTFIVLVILATSFLVYSGTTYCFVPHIKRQKAILKYRDMKFNPYRVKGNLLGTENADVTIELYSDYVCPICYMENIMLHEAVKDFSNIKIIHHNLPFDKECNPYVSTNMHPNACFMARGAIAAGKQGNYWEMSSLLYENQPTKMEDMLKLAEQLGFDKDKFVKDMESDTVAKEIENELVKANNLGLDSTPTIYINGDQIIGIKPYYELKDLLIEHGAKPRK